MMEDYEAINRKAELISRQQNIRDPNTETEQLVQQLKEIQKRRPGKHNTLNTKNNG